MLYTQSSSLLPKRYIINKFTLDSFWIQVFIDITENERVWTIPLLYKSFNWISCRFYPEIIPKISDLTVVIAIQKLQNWPHRCLDDLIPLSLCVMVFSGRYATYIFLAVLFFLCFLSHWHISSMFNTNIHSYTRYEITLFDTSFKNCTCG